jgi:hypothetical protein
MKINIEYEVTTSFQLTIERDEPPEDVNDLLESVTRDELSESPCDVYPIEWGHLKEAWRNADPENTYITDENDNPLYDD